MSCLSLFLTFTVFFSSGTWADTSQPTTCDPKACSSTKPTCRKGESAVETKDENSCCPHFICRANVPRVPRNCGSAVCRMVMPSCPQGQESVNKATEGACCPRWSCVDKKL